MAGLDRVVNHNGIGQPAVARRIDALPATLGYAGHHLLAHDVAAGLWRGQRLDHRASH